jgi:replicative DNA helicase
MSRHALEAAVAGALIIDPDCIDEVCEALADYVFEDVWCMYICRAAQTLRLWEQEVDAVTVRDEIAYRLGAGVFPVEFLARVLDAVPSTADVLAYCEFLRGEL